MSFRFGRLTIAILLGLGFAACGGGDGDSGSEEAANPAILSLSFFIPHSVTLPERER